MADVSILLSDCLNPCPVGEAIFQPSGEANLPSPPSSDDGSYDQDASKGSDQPRCIKRLVHVPGFLFVHDYLELRWVRPQDSSTHSMVRNHIWSPTWLLKLCAICRTSNRQHPKVHCRSKTLESSLWTPSDFNNHVEPMNLYSRGHQRLSRTQVVLSVSLNTMGPAAAIYGFLSKIARYLSSSQKLVKHLRFQSKTSYSTSKNSTEPWSLFPRATGLPSRRTNCRSENENNKSLLVTWNVTFNNE